MTGRAAAGAALVVLALLARPLGDRLRAGTPVRPRASRIGVGPLLGGVLTGAFRPLLLNYLWMRASILDHEGRHDELQTLYRTLAALYPDNPRAREFLAWSQAYNQKREAPTREVAWAWAREGLDQLADLDDEGRAVADWLLRQCGQSAFGVVRYAGPDWEDERWWRARVRAWGRERTGADHERFALRLALLAPPDSLEDRLYRAHLLFGAVLDDWMRTGRSARVEETVRALRRLAGPDGFADNPALAVLYARDARMLSDLAARRLSEKTAASGRYEVAAALWAFGAHDRDAELLRAALAAFDAYRGDPCVEERANVRAWLAFVEGGGGGAPPSLPFDDGP